MFHLFSMLNYLVGLSVLMLNNSFRAMQSNIDSNSKSQTTQSTKFFKEPGILTFGEVFQLRFRSIISNSPNTIDKVINASPFVFWCYIRAHNTPSI